MVDIYAKSHGRHMLLHEHLSDVVFLVNELSKKFGFSSRHKRILLLGALLHDLGKLHPVFQQNILNVINAQNGEESEYIRDEETGMTLRHEIVSLLFLPMFPRSYWNVLIQMIIAHHKSIKKYIGELHNSKGIVDLIGNYGSEAVFEFHSKDWDEWSPLAVDILSHQVFNGLMTPRKVSLEEARDAFDYVVQYCKDMVDREKRGNTGWSKVRGLLMASDHFASAMSDRTVEFEDALFQFPDLSLYLEKKAHNDYPLSFKNVTSKKPHTICIAPTSAGKTYTLIQRCKKDRRVFYVLPHQASLNAMYKRIKKDFYEKGKEIDLRLVHATSRLQAFEDENENDIRTYNDRKKDAKIQRLVGAEMKLLTAHQLSPIIVGSHGYEAQMLDISNTEIIFDEIHAYHPEARTMVMETIKQLVNLGCHVHIGSATIPRELKRRLMNILGGKKTVHEISLTQKEQDTYDRHIVYKHKYSIEKLLELVDQSMEKGRKLLVVANKVAQSQEWYTEIKRHIHGKYSVPVVLIHSRFKRGQRASLETNVIGISKGDQPAIVISTQVIEVSLDINFDEMITDCSPYDSFIQRIGRVNRDRQKFLKASGDDRYKMVHVFEPRNDYMECLPYSYPTLKKTYDRIQDGKVLRTRSIQRRIDAVYENEKWDYTLPAKLIWEIPHLHKCQNKHTSILIDLWDMDTVYAITESDREEYETVEGKHAYETRLAMEIPMPWYVAYRDDHGEPEPRFEQSEFGHKPFIIPNDRYDHILGLLMSSSSQETNDQMKLWEAEQKKRNRKVRS